MHLTIDGVLDSMRYNILSAPEMFTEPSSEHTWDWAGPGT